MSDVGEIESLLFVSGDEGLTLEQIAQLTNSTTDHIEVCLEQLRNDYETSDNRGILLIETANKVKLATKKEYSDIIQLYAQSPYMQKLSRTIIETLAIIAYKQPVTRMEIEEIRGVSATNALQKLKLRDLIQEHGRLEAPGRPVLYATTNYFLDYFGLNDLTELPELTIDENIGETNLFNQSDNQQSFDLE